MSCGCIYELCGIARETMEERHPEIFNEGPTEEMYAQWDLTWGSRRIPWSGEMNGLAECREFGFWTLWLPNSAPYMPGGMGKWVDVPAGTPGAQEDRSRLFRECVWDAGKRLWERQTVSFSGVTFPRTEVAAPIPPSNAFFSFALEEPRDLFEVIRVLKEQLALSNTAVDTATKAVKAWEDLYNERNRLWREAEDRLEAVGLLLENDGCNCYCEHSASTDEHNDDCEPCFACCVAAAMEKR